MKRVGLVLLLTLVLVIAAGTTAFAATYIDWTSEGVNAGTGGPHSNYQTTTEKCAVCHSVHGAPSTYLDPAGTGASKNAQLLLRTSVADACVYCHVTGNTGGVVLYGGNYATYYRPVFDGEYFGHPNTTTGCVRCHSVHGASTLKDATDGNHITEKVLNNAARTGRAYQAAYQIPARYSTAMIEGTAAANRGVQITGFCSQCHSNVSPGSETTIMAPRVRNGAMDMSYTNNVGMVGYSNPAKTHPTKSADVTFNTGGGAGGTIVNTKVAWADSNYCRDCHSAGVDGAAGDDHTGVNFNNFPHYTQNNAFFLGNNAGTAVPTGGQDGVCLKCHRDGTGNGVGLTF